MFHVEAFDLEGEKLKLRKGKRIKVGVPINGVFKKDMDVFTATNVEGKSEKEPPIEWELNSDNTANWSMANWGQMGTIYLKVTKELIEDLRSFIEVEPKIHEFPNISGVFPSKISIRREPTFPDTLNVKIKKDWYWSKKRIVLERDKKIKKKIERYAFQARLYEKSVVRKNEYQLNLLNHQAKIQVLDSLIDLAIESKLIRIRSSDAKRFLKRVITQDSISQNSLVYFLSSRNVINKNYLSSYYLYCTGDKNGMNNRQNVESFFWSKPIFTNPNEKRFEIINKGVTKHRAVREKLKKKIVNNFNGRTIEFQKEQMRNRNTAALTSYVANVGSMNWVNMDRFMKEEMARVKIKTKDKDVKMYLYGFAVKMRNKKLLNNGDC